MSKALIERDIIIDKRKKVDYNKYLELYHQGYSDISISKILKCSSTTLGTFRYKNKLPANFTNLQGFRLETIEQFNNAVERILKTTRDLNREYYKGNPDLKKEVDQKAHARNYIKYRDKILAKRKIYLNNHKEEREKYEKEYYLKNKERIKKVHNEYWLKNKERIKKVHKEYVQKNKEKIRVKRNEWKQRNKEKISIYDKKYRIQKKNEKGCLCLRGKK